MELPNLLPKFPARQMAKVIVQNARFPQPEVVMALDAMAINFFNQVAPGIVDLMAGWSVPFIEGARRASSKSTDQPSSTNSGGSGNLYHTAAQKD